MFESTVDSINSFRDSLGLKSADTGSGSFRNVPFLIINEQKQSGGRRIVKREYPLKEDGGTNDLGRRLRERTFSACVIGKNATDQRDALIEALDAPGAGELVHPDFGTISVLVDTFDCRRNADELNYFEFTITVSPEATATAPESEQDTASAVADQKDSLFGSLGDTLKDAWETVQEATAGATAVMDAVTGVVDDLYDAVENLGVLQDVNSLLSSLYALKGSAQGLLNAPGRLAASVLGAMEGITNICDSSTAFKTYERLGVRFSSRQSSVDVSHIPATAVNNIKALFHVATSAALVSKSAAASGVMTQALAGSSSRSAPPKNPELQADTAALAGSRASSVSAPGLAGGSGSSSSSQLNAITPTTGGASVSSTAQTAVDEQQTHPIFESAADIERVAASLGAELDNAALNAGDTGFYTDSIAITRMRLLTVYDLSKRGLLLPGVQSVTLRQTEPALVTLYRTTGNSQQWQRMTRRNGVINPLFIPGGIAIEVIDEG